MKNNNNIWIWIGIAVLVILLINNYQKVQPEEGMIGLRAHYYKDGVEVFPTRGLFSIVSGGGITPGSYDQISFSIYGSNTGDVPISNIQVEASTSPPEFLAALSSAVPQSLIAGETNKLLWTSAKMNTVDFEPPRSPVNFYLQVSGEFGIETVYAESYSGDIIFQSEFCPVGLDNGDGTCTVTLEPIDDTFADGYWRDNTQGTYEYVHTTYIIGYNRGYFKFDISSLPNSLSITDAKFKGNSYDTGGDFGGGDLNLYDVYDTIWTEETLTYNNQPCGTATPMDNPINCNIIPHTSVIPLVGVNIFDVTQLIQQDYNNNEDYTSWTLQILIGGSRYVPIRSKEYVDPSLRPKLEITYTPQSSQYVKFRTSDLSYESGTIAFNTACDGSNLVNDDVEVASWLDGDSVCEDEELIINNLPGTLSCFSCTETGAISLVFGVQYYMCQNCVEGGRCISIYNWDNLGTESSTSIDPSREVAC